jgi:hypothetical protein
MSKGLAQIPVPPMTDEQLGRILDSGGELMNVDYSPVREAIIRTSAGVASVTHALALRSLQELAVDRPPEIKLVMDAQTLRAAAWSYSSSMQGGMKAQFEKAIFFVDDARILNGSGVAVSSGGCNTSGNWRSCWHRVVV